MAEEPSRLTRDQIAEGLRELNAKLAASGTRGEICLYGGACLCLAFAARNSTKDIDAVFSPAAEIRKAASEIAAERGWPWNWLNDDVSGFLSTRDREGQAPLASLDLSHLKVYAASARYLLAMKCLAARMGGEDAEGGMPQDLADALWLARELGISSRGGIERAILEYYPDSAIPERTDFFVAELLSLLSPG